MVISSSISSWGETIKHSIYVGCELTIVEAPPSQIGWVVNLLKKHFVCVCVCVWWVKLSSALYLWVGGSLLVVKWGSTTKRESAVNLKHNNVNKKRRERERERESV